MAQKKFDYNITIGGEAGQGMQTLGILLTKAFLKIGYEVSTLQSYQSRIRGGHNFFQVRVASKPIHSMKKGIDILIALDQNTLDEHCDRLSDQSLVIYDKGKMTPVNVCGTLAAIDMKTVFPEAVKKDIYGNPVYLGMITALLDLSFQKNKDLLTRTFGKKGEAIVAKNHDAYGAGFESIKEFPDLKERFPTISVSKPRPSLILDGNQALALGAISAGCKFYAAYPMTPSTSIFETMAAFSEQANMVVEQAEDEIAALNMVLGASCAGVRSMTGTSGGGFALMVEALSLAGITETPAVIVNAQRPGPATGLPTRTEQGDLEFVIHAGHGEFPKVVLAPGNHHECFFMTAHAFNLADRFQIPVIILTDQYLADLYTHVAPFRADRIKTDRGKIVVTSEEYLRYRITEDGVSPRGIPGKGRGTVVVGSDEHTEDGHLTEDLAVREKMNRKRLAKIPQIKDEMILPEIHGKHRENLVICWGSSYGPCLDAVQALQDRGKKVSLMHIKQLWPLHEEKITDVFKGFKHLVMVEGNATGQLARVLLSATSIRVDEQIHKFDGKPFLEDELAEWIGARLK